MIIIGEKKDDTNILHLIIGPETDFQFNMTGQSVVDISEYVKNLQNGERALLVVNKCESEEQLAQQLSFHQQKMMELQKIRDSILGSSTNSESSSPPKPTQQKIARLKCPKCKSQDVPSVDGIAMLCPTCKSIDEGLKSGEVPPRITSNSNQRKRKSKKEKEGSQDGF